MIYDENYIKTLLRCKKEIVDPPTKHYKEDRGHMKKNFMLRSVDKLYSFRVFIRYNIKFSENFSIGLDFIPKDEKGAICLFRCNGSHGESKMDIHHSSFHIHFATKESIESGLKPESNIIITEEYASLDQAVQYFINYINIKEVDRNNYFPDKQQTLFGDDG